MLAQERLRFISTTTISPLPFHSSIRVLNERWYSLVGSVLGDDPLLDRYQTLYPCLSRPLVVNIFMVRYLI
jgi:hypothetical protein